MPDPEKGFRLCFFSACPVTPLFADPQRRVCAPAYQLIQASEWGVWVAGAAGDGMTWNGKTQRKKLRRVSYVLGGGGGGGAPYGPEVHPPPLVPHPAECPISISVRNPLQNDLD